MSQIGVLEAEQPVTSRPRFYLDKPTVKSLREQKLVKDIGPRLVRLVQHTIAEIRAWIDGPLGVGNLLPFAKRRSDGSQLHYETPMANDGTWVKGYTPRRDIHVSHRVPDEVVMAQAVAAYNFRLRLRVPA